MKNQKYKILIWIFFTGLSICPSSMQAQGEKRGDNYLNEYLIIAAENNPQLKALFNEYLAALEKVTQEGTLTDPQLSFGYFIQPVETRVGPQRATASISQMFPWFGTLEAQEQAAAQRAKAKLEAFNDAKLELYKEVKTTYNELYFINIAEKITEENLRLLRSFKGIAEASFESGRAGFSSVLQVEMEQEELQSRLGYLEDSKEPLVSELEQLLNIELKGPVNYPDTLWEEQLILDKEVLYDSILIKNPRLEQLEHEAKAYEEQLEVARKMGMPAFTLGMSYTNISSRSDMEIPDNGKDAFIFPQLGVRLPIYRKKYKAMQNEAVLQEEAIEFKKENLENQLLTRLDILYRDYLDARRKIKLYQKLTRLAQQSLDLLQTEISTGQNDLFEMIRMERQLLNYRLELEKARIQKNTSVYEINYLMGK
ncbi:MAG: TolC family protein [Candidatus Cyclobacteriaceae bacterium M2_1C_046]